MKNSPTEPAPRGLSSALERNIDAIVERRKRDLDNAGLEEKVAAAISKFAGSMVFVYLHLAIFGFWIIANVGLVPFVQPWDSSLVVLAMIASVEAIFLSTFVLINQNRMAAQDDIRADLDLQVSLLTEHETTKLIAMVEAIAIKLDASLPRDPEIAELKRDVAPEAVLDKLKQTDG